MSSAIKHLYEKISLLLPEPSIEQKEQDLRPLDADLVLELWSQTYNTSGKPDWSLIWPGMIPC